MNSPRTSGTRHTRSQAYLPLGLTLILGLGVVGLTLFALAAAGPARAGLRCVKPGGGDGCETTIHDALAMAQPGDTIQVAAGTYTENVHITQTVTLQGGWALDFSVRDLTQLTSTIVPADETFSVVYIDGDSGDTGLVAPVVDGFEIAGGRADLGGNHGGGMRIIGSDAVIVSNTIHGNSAFLLGGGIWVAGGSVHIEGNRIKHNASLGNGDEAYGGGLQLDSAEATLVNNVIANNIVSGTITYGAGVGVNGGTLVSIGNEVVSNTTPAPQITNYGGGMYLDGTIANLRADTLMGNRAIFGGGLFNDLGALTVTDSLFFENWGAWGGGLANWYDGVVTIESSSVLENSGNTLGGGVFNGGHAELRSTTFISNTNPSLSAAAGGGGIYSAGPFGVQATLIVEDSIFSGNDTYQDGGAIWAQNLTLSESTLTANSAQGEGGCIFAIGDVVTITNSILWGNSAQDDGGCLRISSPAGFISNTTIAENSSARLGGGIFNIELLTIFDTTIRGNEASFGGGGIFNAYDLNLTNVTLSGNKSLQGGGLDNNHMASLTNVTIAGNQAGFGSLDQGNGGGVNNLPNMSVTAINSIIAENEDLTPNVYAPDCSSDPAGMSSLGHNLVRIADGCNWPMVPFDLVGDLNNPFEPLLGPLADNGGETETHALLAGSPSIDAGHALACPSTDQRGAVRPVDGDGDGQADCDIGAYEYGSIVAWLYLPVMRR